jgi:membrane protein YqaA with SNARE-associated domain
METRQNYRWRRWLPYLSVLLLAAALVLGSVANKLMADWREVLETEARAAQEQRLDELQAAVQRAGLQSEDVLVLVRDLPYAGMSILLDADGHVVYSTPLQARGLSGPLGSLREQVLTDSLRQLLAQSSLSRALESLPADALTPEQRLLLETSYALQVEDGRARPFQDLGRLLTDAQGNPVGAAVVVYDQGDRALPGAYQASFLGALGALALYWLSLPLWVFLDARARGERAWLWAALALVGNLLGVITYLLARQTSRGDCPGCGGAVGRRDNLCPRCGRRLRPSCPACHEPMEEGWRNCPRCGQRVEPPPSADEG